MEKHIECKTELKFGFVGGPHFRGESVARDWEENVREHNENCGLNRKVSSCKKHSAKSFEDRLARAK